jgi:hypothetical protein
LLDHALAAGGARDPHLLAFASQAALQSGEVEQALDAARRAYALQRRNPFAAHALVRALEASDETDAAKTLAQDFTR